MGLTGAKKILGLKATRRRTSQASDDLLHVLIGEQKPQISLRSLDVVIRRGCEPFYLPLGHRILQSENGFLVGRFQQHMFVRVAACRRKNIADSPYAHWKEAER